MGADRIAAILREDDKILSWNSYHPIGQAVKVAMNRDIFYTMTRSPALLSAKNKAVIYVWGLTESVLLNKIKTQ